jgi:3',5'-cyclic AMP phosphodiesterase CpdA
VKAALGWPAVRCLVLGSLVWACNTRDDVTTTRPPQVAPNEGARSEAEGTITDLAIGKAPARTLPDAGAPRPQPEVVSAPPVFVAPPVPAPQVVQEPPACGPMVLTPTGVEHLGRRPYLQNVSKTKALVLFTTQVPEDAVSLQLVSADGTRTIPTQLDPADPTGLQRVARLSGLEPGAVYCYQIADWTGPVRFQTAPPADSRAPVRFIVFGDSGGESRDLVRSEITLYPFDLLLHVGDIAYPTATLANLEAKFFDTYSRVLPSTPIFPASGNHEYRADGAAPFRQVFALPGNGGPAGKERWYSFDWGPVHFVALDTERVGPEQAEWLDADLEQSTLPWTIVYMHRPPFSSGKHGGAPNVRSTFSPLFVKHGVRLVLSGHDHNYERTNPIDGVTYVVTGGGGYSLIPVGSSDFTALSLSIFHFVRVEIGQEALVLQAVDIRGTAFDMHTITRPVLEGL